MGQPPPTPFLDLDVFRMKYGQTRYLLKIVLFIKCQDFCDAIVFHYDAMDYVPHSGMILENALSDMPEKLCEVVILLRADLSKRYLQVL